jgi:hypothetical protein
MEKLQEVIKYLAYLSGKKPHRINKVKLTKLLWIFEGIMYVRTGKRPLGLTYRRNKHGLISPEVDLMLVGFWNADREQAKKEDKDKHIILKAMDIPEIRHLSAEEVALLGWLHNVVMTKGKSPIDEAMVNLPFLEGEENLVGGYM